MMSANDADRLQRNWRAEFFDYLTQERRYSQHTVEAYGSDLNQFQEAAAKDLLSVSSNDIRRFILSRLESGVSAKSVRRKTSALKTFYGFVFAEGGLASDPSRRVRAPKAFDVAIRPITRPEVDQLLARLDTDKALDIRDRALVHVAYGSGLRVSEARNLRIVDIDLHSGVAKVRRGKGQKDRRVPLNAGELDAIRVYLERARPRFVDGADNGYLFIGRRGELLTRQRLWQILTRITKRVVGRGISPHKFRHAFVTDTINGGAEPRVVQKMVGHSSVRTTMAYMHFDLERTRIEYLKAHPRGVEP